MYPLYSWSYDEICARFDKLLANHLHIEAIVASSQTLEQILKRVLKQWMTVEKIGYQKKNCAGQKIVSIAKKEERDEILRTLQGIDDIRLAWNATVANGNGAFRLDEILNQVVGPNSWSILTSKSPVVVPAKGRGKAQQCSFGLFPLRHQLVHGTHSPPKSDIEVFGIWSVIAVKKLLDPDSGLGGLLGWNPQSRISPFRLAKSRKA